MFSLLNRLGVRPEVQQHFAPFLAEAHGALQFDYGDSFEHYAPSFHVVPCSTTGWTAGNGDLNMVRQVLICCSAMEALAFLSLRFHTCPPPGHLLFVAVGNCLAGFNFDQPAFHLPGRKYALLFGRDILGRVADLFVAARLRKKQVAIRYEGQGQFAADYRGAQFAFSEADLSLHAFETASGLRTYIRTYNPTRFPSFLEQLTHQTNHF